MVDMFIAVAKDETIKDGFDRYTNVVSGLKNVRPTIFKRRLHYKGLGWKYRIIYAKAENELVLIDIYCKNKDEKTPTDLIKKQMSGIDKDCEDLPQSFLLIGETSNRLLS
jgi:hypothetical protein